MMDSDGRVILIGLDGATWDLIDEFIDQNKLPALASLKKQGSYGILKSTVPCLSPVAWNSLFSGVSPGKHGIFGFIKHSYNSTNLEFYNSKDRNFPALWNYTSYYGIDSVYINIPFSYPLEETQGVFISGLGTPSEDSPYAAPELKKYIREHFPDYKIDFDQGVLSKKKDRAYFSRESFSIMDNRLALASYFFKSRPWRLFSLVVRAPDVVQHFYWDDRDLLAAVYKKIDNFLSFVISRMSPKDTLILVSDHGCAKLKSMIHLVNYFLQEGYMITRQRKMGWEKFDLQLMRKILLSLMGPKALEMLKRRSGLLDLFFRYFPVAEYSYLRSIDWQSSLVSYVEGSGGIANINPTLKQDSKKLDSFFDELKDRACNLRDEKGDRIFESVYKGEDISRSDTPDIFFKPKPGYFVDGYNSADNSIFGKNKDGYSAFHDENGIVLLFNSGTNKGYDLRFRSIYDILPTIFYILGLDIPDYLDGKVIDEAFSEKIYYQRSFVDKEIFMKKTKTQPIVKTEDKELIEANLKGLGYM